MTPWLLAAKSLRDRRRTTLAWMAGVAALVAVQLWVYRSFRASAEEVSGVAQAMPEALRKIFRMEDYVSETGYLNTELFSATLPLIFISIGSAWGSRIAAEDEDEGTADIVLSLPVRRGAYLAARALASLVVLAAVGAVLTVALVVGTRLLDFSVPVSRYGAAAWHLVLLGATFAALGAAVGGATGRKGAALAATVGWAIVAFVLYSIAPLASWADALLPWNPVQWALGSDAVNHGIDAGYSVRSLALVAVLGWGTFAGFLRRDIRA